MKRPFGLIVVLLIVAGCRAPAPPNDPFLYRSTIPPPGTITGPVGPAGSQPYYNPGSAGAPLISPGVPVTPGAMPPPGAAPIIMPSSPGATPLSPAAPGDQRLGPPGGFNYQSSRQPAAPLNDTAIAPAVNWQAPATVPTVSITNKTPATAAPISNEPSVVRIVEPSSSDTAAAPAKLSSPTAQQLANPLPTGDQASTEMPATISGRTVLSAGLPPSEPPTSIAPTNAVAVGSQQQTAERPIVPEITDLPPHGADPGSSSAPSDAALFEKAQPGAPPPGKSPAAHTTAPGDRAGTTYGYDPQYKSLQGKLEYSVTARRWRLRYMPTDGPVDEYGGSVILSDASQLNGLEPGDFVSAQGSITAATAGAGSLAPLYTLERIKRQ